MYILLDLPPFLSPSHTNSWEFPKAIAAELGEEKTEEETELGWIVL